MTSRSAEIMELDRTGGDVTRRPVLTEAPGPSRDDVLDGPVSARALHVLIVDDVAMNRDIAGYFLRTSGHRVSSLDAGEAAVAAVAMTDFDLVLMDVCMPEMDGLEATRRIRALSGMRGQVPIVAMTAHVFEAPLAACRKAGMNGQVAKPFDQDALINAVLQAVATGFRANPFKAQFMSFSMPPANPIPMVVSDLPVLVLQVFNATVACLAPKAAAMYLNSIGILCEGLLRMLHVPAALAPSGNELASAAHTVAASAGMFGFERLTATARQFQRAVEASASQVPTLTDVLGAAIRATLFEIQSLTAAI